MYWTRADNVWGFLPWLLLSSLWGAGGFLICASVFRLRPGERLVCGLGMGVLLFIVLSNLAAYLAPFPLALWAGSGLTLFIGLTTAWKSGFRLLPFGAGRRPGGWNRGAVFSNGFLLLVLAGLTLLFGRINRGLAIFDDYHNLPLVSLMAAGDVPPHFYLNTAHRMAYHYGWHLFAASLVRVGDLFPWSAFDISKAFSLALMAALAWLWFRRWTRSRLGAFLGALLAVLGGGARWLLLFLSPERLADLSAGIALQGTSAYSGPSLAANLSGPWLIEGDGPLHFPFAFANGIFPPAIMALGGSGAIPLATVFLLLLLARRSWSVGSASLYSLALASLGLTAEYLLVPLVVGLSLVAAGVGLARRPPPGSLKAGRSHPGRPPWVGWLVASMTGALLAFAQGGLLTEMARRTIDRLSGGAAVEGSGFIGFALRWPPAIVSAHLGSLSLANPGQILVALAEMGPVLLLAPWATAWAWKQARRGNILAAGMGAAAWIGFLAPVFVEYLGRDRDITHMSGSALFLWLALAFPLAWQAILRLASRPPGATWAGQGAGKGWLPGAAWLVLPGGMGVALFGGLVLLAFQMLAIQRPQFTTFVTDQDAALAAQYWNRLEPGAQVLDDIPYRAITLFGRGGGRAFQDFFLPLPEWKALLDDPDPVVMARAGYSYLYHDQEWWGVQPPEARERFRNPCVKQVNRGAEKGKGMRRLLDIRDCR